MQGNSKERRKLNGIGWQLRFVMNELVEEDESRKDEAIRLMLEAYDRGGTQTRKLDLESKLTNNMFRLHDLGITRKQTRELCEQNFFIPRPAISISGAQFLDELKAEVRLPKP